LTAFDPDTPAGKRRELLDELADICIFAHGIETAVSGLEVNDALAHSGVKQLIRTHIDALNVIHESFNKLFIAAGEA
jgi:hypothetical protein